MIEKCTSYYLQAGTDINIQNRKGLTVLHYSIIRARTDIFKYLRSLGPKLDMIDHWFCDFNLQVGRTSIQRE